MSRKKRSIPWLFPLLVLAAGLLFSLLNVQNASLRLRRINRKGTTVKELTRIEQQLVMEKASYRQYQQGSEKSRKPLEPALAQLGGSPPAQSSRLTAVSLLGDWLKEQIKITGTDLSLENMNRFLSEATALRPPWILEQCEIKSTPKAGYADVTLVLQTVYLEPQPSEYDSVPSKKHELMK